MTERKRNEAYLIIALVVLSCILVLYYTALLDSISGEATLVFYTGAIIFGIQQLLIVYVGLDSIEKRCDRKTVCLDPLTGALLENQMEEAMKKFLKKNTQKDGEWALVRLEITSFERFKALFDRVTADHLLRLTASPLLQEYTCVTRIGESGFAFLAPNVPRMGNAVRDALRDAVSKNLGAQYLDRIDFRLGICPVGTLYGRSPEDLHHAARLALKEAKSHPETPAVVYSEKLHRNAQLESRIELNMLYALSKEEFKVFIQPKCRIADGSCCGGEALVRWNSEKLGFLNPGSFIPVFEKTGFIAEVDFFVLSAVIRAIRKMLAEDGKILPVSVNQSKTTISCPSYFQRLRNLIKDRQDVLPYLELEITESVLESDFEAMLSRIRTLKEMGFSVSLDDFGSGYSSLNVLRNLPVDTIKLDRVFLKDVDTHEKNRIIIRNVVNMTRDLRLNLVCEGVETEAQFNYLRRIGCKYAQGFFCAKPMPFSDYEKTYLKASSKEKPAWYTIRNEVAKA